MVDGTLISIDRVAADRPFYSGKHRRHGMNLQVIVSPDENIVDDLTTARIWRIIRELAASGLVVLGDKGDLGEDCIRVPYRVRNKPSSQKDANWAHTRLRAPGERAKSPAEDVAHPAQAALLPWRAGQLARAIHVLQTREIVGWKTFTASRTRSAEPACCWLGAGGRQCRAGED